MLGVSPNVSSSKPLKRGDLTRQELFPVDTSPVGAPVKRAANVAFNVNELSDDLVGASKLMKVMRSVFGPSDKTVTSIGRCVH